MKGLHSKGLAQTLVALCALSQAWMLLLQRWKHTAQACGRQQEYKQSSRKSRHEGREERLAAFQNSGLINTRHLSTEVFYGEHGRKTSYTAAEASALLPRRQGPGLRDAHGCTTFLPPFANCFSFSPSLPTMTPFLPCKGRKGPTSIGFHPGVTDGVRHTCFGQSMQNVSWGKEHCPAVGAHALPCKRSPGPVFAGPSS